MNQFVVGVASLKEGSTIVVSSIAGDVTHVLYSGFHPIGETLGTFSAPVNEIATERGELQRELNSAKLALVRANERFYAAGAERNQLRARAEWLQRMHTLHRAVEMLYVVDGYQVTICWDGDPISPDYHGETLELAIDKAMAEFDAEARPKWVSRDGDPHQMAEELAAARMEAAQFNGFDISKLPPILISCVAKLWPGSNGLFWDLALEKMPERIEHLLARPSAIGAEPTAESVRLTWMAKNQVAIEEMVIAAAGGDRPLWYIAERFARRGHRAPAQASSPRRVYGESEVSIEAAIDNAMERQAAGNEPYYA